MSSSAVKSLLNKGHNVTLICEEIGAELLSGGDFSVISYKRDDKFKMPINYLRDAVSGFNIDCVILTVPSFYNEGRQIFPGHSNIVAFDPLGEWELRKFHHTVELNVELVRKLLGDRTIVAENYIQPDCFEHYEDRGHYQKVAFHIGPQSEEWKWKAFPLSLYREIMLWLKDEYNLDSFIIGDENQTQWAKYFDGIAEDRTGLSIKETAQLLYYAKAMVGNDCGPAHLASAYVTPTVVFFGPTFSGRTAPWPLSNRNRRIQSIVPCGPCHLFGSRMKDCLKPICHDQVTLQDFQMEWSQLGF
jgi:ADP-heptose:LPS heptosyltransferase